MSFGKRQPPGATPVKRTQRRSSEPASAPPSRRSPMLLLAGIACGFALIAAGATAFVSGMRQIGKKLDAQFEAQMNETVSPTPQHNVLKTKTADGWNLGNCRMKRPPSAVNSIVPGDYAERDAMFGKMMDTAGSDFSVELANTANFIECIASDEAPRLCDTSVRTAFAADITRFYREHAVIAHEFANTRNSQDKKFAEVMATLQAANPDIGEAFSFVDGEMSQSKEKVDDALASAIAAGYVTPGDFGWFAPAAVKSVFAATKPNRKACV